MWRIFLAAAAASLSLGVLAHPGTEPVVAAFALVCAALAAAPVLSPRVPLTLSTGAALVAGLCLGRAGPMTAADLFQPLQAQVHGQGPLVFARLALVLEAALCLPRVPRRRRALLAALLAAAFVASWAAELALVALALAVVAVALQARARPAPPAWPRPLLAGVVVAAAAAAVALAARPPPPAPPVDARGAALAWLARDNPWRALPAARAWAGAEKTPGAGTVCLARVAARLGDGDVARGLLGRVLKDGSDAAAREDAKRVLATLVAAPTGNPE